MFSLQELESIVDRTTTPNVIGVDTDFIKFLGFSYGSPINGANGMLEVTKHLIDVRDEIQKLDCIWMIGQLIIYLRKKDIFFWTDVFEKKTINPYYILLKKLSSLIHVLRKNYATL